MAWLTLMPGSFSSLLVAVSARKLTHPWRPPSCGLMRLDLSADAANSLFVVCLSNPAYAWNDHTKLMFPNAFIKLP
jgi:hypothetical protein